ncbi:PTS system mannose/fructose/sorbose family transporter subunit IID [Holdemania filiformis]|uniref:PTS system mannose/fructose/sorbose family transporter subunit IID n=1 Tax=Holdemania filiformis TaxID=61171 RepID=UPI00242C55F2|nr:PTS system mannose/fructose/sorbose family transporter subunit IID [Holdemania filiformis]
MSTFKRKLTKKDLWRIYFRGYTFQSTQNFERMQAIGFLSMMTPALEKLYADRPKEERIAAMKRHLQFYNNHNTMNHFVIGLCCALEETTDETQKDSVTSIKTGLMGPLAGVGDGLYFNTFYPILASIGATIALDGNLFGALFLLISFGLINHGSKILMLKMGYEKGMDLILSGEGQKIIATITTFATILGLFVVGQMITSTVSLKTVFTFASGEGVIELQALLDKITPKLLNVGVVAFCYGMIRKTGGKGITALLFGLMIAGMLLSYIGFLG